MVADYVVYGLSFIVMVLGFFLGRLIFQNDKDHEDMKDTLDEVKKQQIVDTTLREQQKEVNTMVISNKEQLAVQAQRLANHDDTLADIKEQFKTVNDKLDTLLSRH